MKSKLIILTLIFCLFGGVGCRKEYVLNNPDEPTVVEFEVPEKYRKDIYESQFYVLLCPKGHQVYFTDYTLESGDAIMAYLWHTKNRGYFYKGIYQPMGWSEPIPAEEARCFICNSGLIFWPDYLIMLN